MMKLDLKWLGILGMGIALSAGAQTPDVVALPNPDDFLGETYSIPSDPISVPAVPADPVLMPSVTTIPNVAPSGNTDILTEIFGKNAITLDANQSEPVPTRSFTPTPGLYYPKHAVLTKLPDLPPPQLTVERPTDTTIAPVIHQPTYADELLEATERGKSTYFSIPKEIRIKFHPGQSALSAQALKWIKSFALMVRGDPRLVIEIRASAENWPLQSKRVGLMLQSILEMGVSRHQIVVYKSARSVDAVLLGYGYAVEHEVETNKKRQKTITW